MFRDSSHGDDTTQETHANISSKISPKIRQKILMKNPLKEGNLTNKNALSSKTLEKMTILR